MPDDGLHFTNAVLTEAFRRVANAISSSRTVSDHSKTVAIQTLEQVRDELQPELPPDQPIKPLPDAPTGWQGADAPNPSV
jgi:hypothetical protein